MPPEARLETIAKNGPLISAVIVNWNGRRFLDGCLGSIYGQGYGPLEVILVDNGSTDGSVEFVRRSYPKTVIIENSSNAGFAAANNQGIRASKGKYVLTLNNDTELAGGFLGEIASAAEGSGSDVGMWAAKILSFHERDVIDSVGGLLLYADGLGKGRGRLERDAGQYDAVSEILIPSACAALYRKCMLEETGGFDDDFFAYCEDTDLGLRCRLAGWKARSAPKAVVYHYYSGTSGKYSPFKAYLVERNRLWVAMKNFPFPCLVASFFHTFRRYAVQTYGILAGKGAGGRFVEDFSKMKLAGVLLKAYAHALLGLPGVLRKRGRIQAARSITLSEFRGLFRDHGLSAAEAVLKD